MMRALKQKVKGGEKRDRQAARGTTSFATHRYDNKRKS
jgi:hypothetical protein